MIASTGRILLAAARGQSRCASWLQGVTLFSLSSFSAFESARAGAAFAAPAQLLGARAFSTGKVTPIKLPKIRPQGRVPFEMSQTTLKVACLQLACGADKKKNLENAANKIREAAQASLLPAILPCLSRVPALSVSLWKAAHEQIQNSSSLLRLFASTYVLTRVRRNYAGWH